VVEINRSVHDVFAFLADLENVPRWNYAISKTRKISPGEVGVGTTYEQTRSIPTPSREYLRITSFEPDRQLTVEGTLARYPARLEYTVDEHDGATRLTNRVDLELIGAAKLIGGVAAGRIRSAVAANLEVLKTLLDSGS
jgi:Polyketide cyclase / dehydrase and lipid transport